MRYGAVEEEVHDIQEVRGSNHCKDGAWGDVLYVHL